ncbi:MAG: hypothetical protein ABIN48_08870 [Ginsengibacter sp.]
MTASVSEIKKELEKRDKQELLAFCLRLIKYKKENKELLSFILFESEDIPSFIQHVKEEADSLFEEMNMSNVYYIKKTTRKILRNITKYIRFAESKEIEAELLIYFCNCFERYDIPVNRSRQLLNIYTSQVKKIEAAIEKLHPDLQYDLRKTLIQ